MHCFSVDILENDSEQSDLLDYFTDENTKEVIKRAVDDLEIDTSLYRVAKWIPSKPEKVEKRSLGEEEESSEDFEEEQPITSSNNHHISERSEKRNGKFLWGSITVSLTTTSTVTTTTTTTLGPAAITGNTSQCGSTSITDYVKKCG